MQPIDTLKNRYIYKIPEKAKFLVVEEHYEFEDFPECYELSFIDSEWRKDFFEKSKSATMNFDDQSKMIFTKEVHKKINDWDLFQDELWNIYLTYRESDDEPLDESDIEELIDNFKKKLFEHNGIISKEEFYKQSPINNSKELKEKDDE